MSPRKKRYLKTAGWLLFALALAGGPEVRSLGGWKDATSTAFIGNMLSIVGGLGIAWMVNSPIAFGRDTLGRYRPPPLKGPDEE